MYPCPGQAVDYTLLKQGKSHSIPPHSHYFTSAQAPRTRHICLGICSSTALSLKTEDGKLLHVPILTGSSPAYNDATLSLDTCKQQSKPYKIYQVRIRASTIITVRDSHPISIFRVYTISPSLTSVDIAIMWSTAVASTT